MAHFDASPRQVLHYQPNNVCKENQKNYLRSNYSGFQQTTKITYTHFQEKDTNNIISEYIFESENSENLSKIELVWDRVGRKVIRVMVASAASVCATRDR